MKKMQWVPKGQKNKKNETKLSSAPSPQLQPSHAQPRHKKKIHKKKQGVQSTKVEFKRAVVIADDQPKRLTVSTPAASAGFKLGYMSALQMQLFTAVYYGLLEDAKLAIREGADVNRICGDNFTLKHSHTLLYIACYQAYSALVSLLLENKADVNQPIDDGSTPLIVACQRNTVNVVKLLLDYRALVNIFDNDGETPIFAAAGVGAIDIVSLLIDKGVGVNSKNNNARGATPLFIACQQGHARMVKLLLTKGADIDQTRNDGISPLQIATIQGHLAVVELLNNWRKTIVKASADADRPKINAVTKKEEKHTSVFGADLLKEIPKKFAFLPPPSMAAVNVIKENIVTMSISSTESKKYVVSLSDILGQARGKDIVQIDAKKSLVSFPSFWLRQLRKEAIEELSKNLSVSSEVFKIK